MRLQAQLRSCTLRVGSPWADLPGHQGAPSPCSAGCRSSLHALRAPPHAHPPASEPRLPACVLGLGFAPLLLHLIPALLTWWSAGLPHGAPLCWVAPQAHCHSHLKKPTSNLPLTPAFLSGCRSVSVFFAVQPHKRALCVVVLNFSPPVLSECSLSDVAAPSTSRFLPSSLRTCVAGPGWAHGPYLARLRSWPLWLQAWLRPQLPGCLGLLVLLSPAGCSFSVSFVWGSTFRLYPEADLSPPPHRCTCPSPSPRTGVPVLVLGPARCLRSHLCTP